MMKVLTLLIATICYAIPTWAQLSDGASSGGNSSNLEIQTPDVVPPSPTVASLMRFEEVPINYYSGQPDISIPLYSKQLPNGPSINLALRYSTMGVKVFERSGWVGTGWALEAGGTISRTVRGLPDDLPARYASRYTGLWANDDFWNYESLDFSEQARFKWKVKGSSQDKYDSQMDLYQFSFPGGSGRFVVVKVGDDYEAKLISKDQLVKIDLQMSNIGFHGPCLDSEGQDCVEFNYLHIDGFTVTDRNGFVYEFTEKEYKKSVPHYRYIAHGNPLNRDHVIPGADSKFRAITAWHLTSIKNSNGVLLASLDYEWRSSEYQANVTNTFNAILDRDGASLENAYNQGILRPARSITHHEVQEYSKTPKSITFVDSTKIAFRTKPGTHPETGSAILDAVEIYKNSADQIPVKTYELHTSTEAERLWLDKVEEKAGDITLPYEISYQNKSGLPAHGTVGSFPITDTWGYKHTTSVTGKKDGLIRSITFPTGGKKEFSFEEHTYSYVGEDLVSQTEVHQNPDVNNLIRRTFSVDDYFTSLDSEEGILLGSFGPLDFSQQVDVHILNFLINGEYGVEAPGSETLLLALYDSDGNRRSSHDITSEQFTMTVPAGEVLQVRIHYLNADGFSLKASIRFNYNELIEGGNEFTTRYYLTGGGFRIGSVHFTEAGQQLRTFTYSYFEDIDDQGRLLSSGAVDGASGTIGKAYTQRVKKYLFNFAQNQFNTLYEKNILYSVRQIGSVNASLTKGGFVGYRKVTERGNDGATIYFYSTAKDHPSPRSSFVFPFAPKPELDYKRGLLKRQELRDNSGRLVRSIDNEYDFFLDESDSLYSLSLVDHESCRYAQFFDAYDRYIGADPDTNVPSCQSIPGSPSSLSLPCFNETLNIAPCDPYVFHLNLLKEHHQFGWARLISTTERDYFYELDTTEYANAGAELREDGSIEIPLPGQENLDPYASFNTKFRRYTYNIANYQVNSIEEVLQEGDKALRYLTEYAYPVGGNTTGGNSNFLIQQMKTLNKVVLPLEVKVSRALESPSGDHVYYPLTTVRNRYRTFRPDQIELEKVITAKGENPFEERLIYHAYNDLGNIQEYSKSDDIHTLIKWGHNGTLPVLMLQNCNYDELSETQLNLLDGLLDLNGLSNGVITSHLTNLINNFPASFITAYGYDLYLGQTLQVDPNLRISRFSYDALGRTERILDHEDNVLQEFEYNYRNQ